MNLFTEPLHELAEFEEAAEAVKRKKLPLQISGCVESQKCHFIYALGDRISDGRGMAQVIVTHDETRAKELYEDYRLYDKNVYLYPAKDVIFYSADVHGNAITSRRLTVLKALQEEENITIITTIDAGMDRILPFERVQQHRMIVAVGEMIDLSEMKKELVRIGYEHCGQVEAAGQFAVRGGIIDIFPLTQECPYRIELFDDEVDTIRSFDVESQRSMENFDELVVYPASEFILDETTVSEGLERLEKEKKEQVSLLKKEKKLEECRRIAQVVDEFKESLELYAGSFGMESYVNYFFPETVSFFDYFTEDTLFYLDEPGRIAERGEAVTTEFQESMTMRLEKGYLLPGQVSAVYSYGEILNLILRKRVVFLSTLDFKQNFGKIAVKANLEVQSVNSYQKNFSMLVEDVRAWKKQGYRVVLLSPIKSRAVRLSDDLKENGIDAYYSENLTRPLERGEVIVTYGNVRRGFVYPMIQFAVISESDIFGKEKRRKVRAKKYEGDRIHSFTELNIGDYVVHENYGIGIYRGIEKIEVDKVIKDYVKISYDKGGELYILATGLEVLQKYAAKDAKKPKLNRLDSPEWKKTKSRVKSAVNEVAKELVELYAKRREKEGHCFGEDTIWQAEFEEAFPFEETEDQLLAIAATKRDMESKKIMDRLICGDVGFGKTEIAIRAAFKAVQDGCQVAILVPTTILAQQHYNTILQRMKNYPVNVEMLSRFRTPAQQKKALEGLKKGQVDIVVGTHRLLSKDVTFKKLGLLVVDEEQRFGVTHKEKIKLMKENIDVLTLTATPIPRTLHMSLVGIRDMSVLEEPPVDRLPIQTFVMEHNDEIIREAISRELARGGQVYYVYNRVQGIENVADVVHSLVPDANVAYAHGQMSERQLEQIMYEFINGEIDVLVATTIVETGLDISNVNTMIIDDADRLGLSQLYQLRGRVGRSNRTSYAFLMYKRDKMLREVAEKRLLAIKEFTDLGSGFKIAMRDLEIRGAGSLLGERQHGHMEAVGYDMYCRMLNEAVKQLKGIKTTEEEFATTMKFDKDAYIPVSYIKSEFQKLDIYKRISEIENKEEYLDLQGELIDRFGEPPAPVNNLLSIALVKSIAHKAGITMVKYEGNRAEFELYEKAAINPERIPELLEQYKGKLKFSAKGTPSFSYQEEKGTSNNQVFKNMEKILLDICTLIDEEK